MTLAEISSSTVFDRSSVSGPSSLHSLIFRSAVGGLAREHWARRSKTSRGLRVHRAGDFGNAGNQRVLARRREALLGRAGVDVGEAHLLHGVQVIEVTPELLEAVRGRQRVGVIAEMVLAELAGVVAEVEQELGERRSAGPQIGRAARQLRRDHARAQRVHAGEEGVAPGRAALLGVVVHEPGALICDAIKVGRFAQPHTLLVAAQLHPADVVFVAFSTATDCMWRRVVQATRRCAFWTTVPKGYQYNWNMLPVGQQLWWHPAMTPSEAIRHWFL